MLRLALAICLVSVSSIAADEKPDPAAMRAEMQKQLELIKPGPEHSELMKLSGEWDVAMMMGPRDLRFDGSATSSMILGDRFLVIDGSGKPGGRDAGFRYTIGFDRRHGEYVITLRDTAGTYPVHARGKSTDSGIRMVGTDDDPRMTEMGLTKKFAFRLVVQNEDEFFIETIYIDTRTEVETDRAAFRYIFTRSDE